LHRGEEQALAHKLVPAVAIRQKGGQRKVIKQREKKGKLDGGRTGVKRVAFKRKGSQTSGVAYNEGTQKKAQG